MGKVVLTKGTALLISDIKIPFLSDECEAVNIAISKMKHIGIDPSLLHFHLYKKSLDARKKDNVLFVCTVAAELCEDILVNDGLLKKEKIRICKGSEIELEFGDEIMCERPLVVGMGPAGMFSALMLAENGYRPIIIDRGDSVDDRVNSVERFYREKVLDTDSNIQFGAGGAGTFSDGKLVTRIKDAKCDYVLHRLYEFGAPEDILTKAKPHVGTDILRTVVKNILARIEELGGTVIYRCRMDDYARLPDGTLSVKTGDGNDIKCSLAVLALGHSARDTYKMLLSKNFAIEPKPFSVGLRIEHLQSDIERALYGDLAGHEKMPSGEYALSDTKGERGVYTFCMCPGGEVVAATSEEGGVVVNGMSHHARNSGISNSAVAVSVNTSDYGNTPEGAIEYQRRLERAAFSAGGKSYAAPCQTVGGFLDGRLIGESKKLTPSYMNDNVMPARLDELLPSYISENLKRGLLSFDKKLHGFADPEAMLTGIETRTSAPVRILRGTEYTALTDSLIYPCGEGAGYAGGITSAAVDGIKTALAVMRRFAPPKK